MEFITKKMQRFLEAFEVSLGLVIITALIGIGIITSKMGNIYVPHEEIIAIVGTEPKLSDFGGGGKKLIQAKEEYSKKYKIERNKKLAVIKAERKVILNQKLKKLSIAEAFFAIIIFILYYRTIVKSFKIDEDTITFTYTNNKQKQIKILENNMEFKRIRLFSIRYLFIPRIYHIFYYTYKASKKDQIVVHISKEEGIKISEYFADIKK